MKKRITIIALILILFSCKEKEVKVNQTKITKIELSNKTVNQLLELPLHCVETEYPNKLSQVIGDASYLKTPKELHPAFYGCFDWHSSVHGHWSLVKLLKDNPEIDNFNKVINLLKNNISKENILQEVKYFDDRYNKNYERTYGWSWLLKLSLELHTWDSKDAKILENNLQPLTDLIVGKYIEFFPKLNYPIRVGTHSNTAFGLSFAFDYAKEVDNQQLLNVISKRAKYFYINDVDCPMSWEPSGTDFLSPCLEEASLMKRVLNKEEYSIWLHKFLPDLYNKNYQLKVGIVSDRTDGHLVHLDGLNFSRAWCLNTISKDLPELSHLQNTANKHLNYSLPNLVGDSYEGGHWLASFAIYALDSQ
ncbi:MAG TPA: DUF2891 domain-containing protein [Flavobacteriaceae bacterium]|nr:DUF2891 domain-containing protein [Flavobacteriaceae bacterium]